DQRKHVTESASLDLDVPENGRAELEDALHVLAEGAGGDELAPGDVGHLVVGQELDLLAELLLLGLIRLAHPLRPQLLHALPRGPAEPRLLTGAVDEGVDGGAGGVEGGGPGGGAGAGPLD